MKTVWNILAVLVVVAGLIWALQGANVIGGSAMSGHAQWVYVGIVLVLAGAAWLWWLNRRRSIP